MNRKMLFALGLLATLAASNAWAKTPARTAHKPVRATIPTDDLHRSTAAAYRDYISQLTDRFATDTVDSGLIGKPFHFVTPFSNGNVPGGSGGGSPFYSYEDGQLLLTLSKDETKEGRHPVIVGRERILNASSYIGQNAYGAAARVSNRRILSQGLAIIDGPLGERDSAYSSIGSSTSNFDYWFRTNLAGPDAKRLALDADLVIDGQFVTLDNGKAADCISRISDPTIDNPKEIFDIKCFVGAKVSRVAFIRRSTGTIIKEWTDGELKASNPSPR